MLERCLLASDLDGTLIPLEDEPEWEAEIARFSSLVQHRNGLVLVYVTGRHLELALDGVAHFDLPLPEVMVCDVGTTVYKRDGRQWVLDEVYRRRLLESWQGKSGDEIARLLIGVAGLEEQEKVKQGEFKQSFYLAEVAWRDESLQMIRAILKQEGIEVNLVFSVDSLSGRGLLDILPAMAAKDRALDYLRELYELPVAQIVYAGDSGNDLSAFVSGYKAIVVGNTTRPVCDETERLARERGIKNKIFFARHDYVRGVMEGCSHFQVF